MGDCACVAGVLVESVIVDNVRAIAVLVLVVGKYLFKLNCQSWRV